MSLPSTQSSVIHGANLILDLPENDASLDLFATVVFYKITAGTPTVTTPSGWTLIDTETVFATECQSALFWKVGDGSASVSFVFSATCNASAGCVVMPGRASSPYEAATVAFRGPTTTYSSNSLTTTIANEILLGIWAGYPLTPSFNPIGMDTDVNIGGGSSDAPSLCIADDFQAVAGATGSRTATTFISGAGTVFLLGWKPDNRPTTPSVLFAHGGESLTAGATVALTCTASSSPSVATSALQYEFSYSLDNGGTWTVIGLSPAGVTSKTWTVPSTLGNTNLIRVRAYDGTLYSPTYGTGTAFSIVAESKPTVTIISPVTGSVQAKSASQVVTWSYSGGAGNPQTQYTGEVATSSSFVGATTIGPTSTASQSAMINTTGFADGATVWIRFKAKDAVQYSDFSPAVAFVVASAPAAPNITAPTNASPPTSSTYTVTFTESSDFVARKFRVVQSSVEVFNETVLANVLSFPSPFPFANGVAVTIYLSVKNAYELWSTEDSETVTPSYTGPTKPTLVCTGMASDGYILLKITDSGTRTADYLYRRINGEAKSAALRITPALTNASSQFADYSVASDVDYVYFVRCYNGTLFTDSDDSSPISITLDSFFLHAVSRTALVSGVLGSSLKLLNQANTGGHDLTDDSSVVALLGRSEPGAIFGQMTQESLTLSTFFPFVEQARYDAFLAIYEAQRANGTVLLARNNLADRIFCKMAEPKTIIDVSGYWITAALNEVEYNENV